jgi:NADH-quinone oxidoreductase subunit G
MLSYHAVHDSKTRVTQAIIRNGETRTTSVQEALSLVRERLAKVDSKKLAVVLSAQFSCEDNEMLAQFARDVLGADSFFLGANAGWEGDKILRNSDNNPNRAGALAAARGAAVRSLGDLVTDVRSGAVEAVIALGGSVAESASELAALRSLGACITFASNRGSLDEVAQIVVPVASWAEMDGTFVNAKGVAQRFMRAIRPPASVQPAWQTLVALAELFGKPLAQRELSEVRRALPQQEVVG